MLKRKFTKDWLEVNIYTDRDSMGAAAASDASAVIADIIRKKGYANVIFAAAPSQNEVLASLVASGNVDWTKVRAFHMDEYIGLDRDAPQGFGNFLEERIFGKLPFAEVYYLAAYGGTPDEICSQYSAKLEVCPPDVVMMGIGENGHIAFNDPPVADFNDPKKVKIVDLDEICRNQQVNDGCFASIDLVPKQAITLTVPTLFGASHLFCTVPAQTKANAVYEMINGSIDEHCPATILRRHPDARLYLDPDSSAKLN